MPSLYHLCHHHYNARKPTLQRTIGLYLDINKLEVFFLQGSISNPGDGIAIARAVVNTALGTSAAGICTLVFNKTGIVPGSGQYYSFLVTMNGSLTGKYLAFSSY